MKKLFLILLLLPAIYNQTFSKNLDCLHNNALRLSNGETFEQFLEDCNYSPHCIKYLRDRPYNTAIMLAIDLPDKNRYDLEINLLVKNRYLDEYRHAIAKKESRAEKLSLLQRMEQHLTREPLWIEHGYEPGLLDTNDGSDRGLRGLRYKALKKVRKEIEACPE